MVHNAAAMKSKAFEAKWALCFGRTIERWGKPSSHYLLVMGHAAEFSGQFWSEGPTEYFLKNLQPFSFFSQTTTSLLLFFSLGRLKLTWASILPLLSSRIPPWLAWGHKPQMVSQSLRLTLSTVRLLESDLKNPLQNTTITRRVQRYLIGQMVRLTSLLWTWATQSALRRPEQPKCHWPSPAPQCRAFLLFETMPHLSRSVNSELAMMYTYFFLLWLDDNQGCGKDSVQVQAMRATPFLSQNGGKHKADNSLRSFVQSNSGMLLTDTFHFIKSSSVLTSLSQFRNSTCH